MQKISLRKLDYREKLTLYNPIWPSFIMNSQSNPILIEMSDQLPETSKTYKFIRGPETHGEIYIQAKEEFSCLSDLDAERGNGLTGRTLLAQSGYENLLEDMEEEDRLRLIGILSLIIELAEDLADE